MTGLTGASASSGTKRVSTSNGPRSARTFRPSASPSSVTLKDAPLVNTPGTTYYYSTRGYILLSAVVERAGKLGRAYAYCRV